FIEKIYTPMLNVMLSCFGKPQRVEFMRQEVSLSVLSFDGCPVNPGVVALWVLMFSVNITHCCRTEGIDRLCIVAYNRQPLPIRRTIETHSPGLRQAEPRHSQYANRWIGRFLSSETASLSARSRDHGAPGLSGRRNPPGREC